MELTTQLLEDAALSGSGKVAEAMTTLVGDKVSVSTSEVRRMLFKDALEMLSDGGEYAVVVYSTIDSPSFSQGVAILTMSRTDALLLIDVLNRRDRGSTSIMKDVDRSAIKEILNILSNSYINQLAESTDSEIRIEAPNMITVLRLQEIMKVAFSWKEGEAKDSSLVFEALLTVTEHEIRVGLFLLFHDEIANLLASN